MQKLLENAVEINLDKDYEEEQEEIVWEKRLTD